MTKCKKAYLNLQCPRFQEQVQVATEDLEKQKELKNVGQKKFQFDVIVRTILQISTIIGQSVPHPFFIHNVYKNTQANFCHARFTNNSL